MEPVSRRHKPQHHPGSRPFMFATGIENSYPTIVSAGRKIRVDEMDKTDHYRRYKEDFALVLDLGLEYLRWGPPYHLSHSGPGKYDWDFTDAAMEEIRARGIVPIIDLCHFGLPDWLGDFQNGDWPSLFAEYAGVFAARYPWVRFYTPVNEIFITATFSAQWGWWNERLTSDRAFVTALKNLAKANLLAEAAIIRRQPEGIFIQSESTEYFHPEDPQAFDKAEHFNQKRFLSLDLCYGVDVAAYMYEYLMDNGMTRDEYHWFHHMGAGLKPRCIMGNDYYITNEHLVSENGPVGPSGELFGYYVITRQYFERYHLPVMHTETNFMDSERAPAWLWKEWVNMIRLKQDGVPIVGFTWYSLLDQVDWDTALREDNNRINPLGLFDLDRRIRPVGEAYRKLVGQWKNILPMESLCLDMHPSLTAEEEAFLVQALPYQESRKNP